MGVAPQCLIAKNMDRSSGGGEDWHVWHTGFGPQDKYIWLNHNNPAYASSNYFTAVSSTTFTLGTDTSINANDEDIICYAFTGIEGYSKFGSYVGNSNSNGPFIYTGFKPAYLLVKCVSDTAGWDVTDGVRSTYNPQGYRLAPNTTGVGEDMEVADFTSNGFKVRTTSGSYNDPNAATYIYLAFAESPFKYSNAR